MGMQYEQGVSKAIQPAICYKALSEPSILTGSGGQGVVVPSRGFQVMGKKSAPTKKQACNSTVGRPVETQPLCPGGHFQPCSIFEVAACNFFVCLLGSTDCIYCSGGPNQGLYCDCIVIALRNPGLKRMKIR